VATSPGIRVALDSRANRDEPGIPDWAAPSEAATTMDFHGWFNLCEAGLWFTLGAMLAIRSPRATGTIRTLGLVAAIALVAFGVTDVIEIRTRHWGKPLGLLLLKAACIATLVFCYAAYLAVRRRERRAAECTDE
jgi:hypothetical protein